MEADQFHRAVKAAIHQQQPPEAQRKGQWTLGRADASGQPESGQTVSGASWPLLDRFVLGRLGWPTPDAQTT